MWRIFRIVVEVPALDRLMDYLEAAQQEELDLMEEQVRQLTARLSKSQTALQGAITKETHAS
jgi:uncharacterized coiled-coil protein SlyX